MTCSLWAFFAGLLLQAVLPFAAGIPLWISERCMEVVIAVGSVIAGIPWSQTTAAAPSVEITLFIAAALIGTAAVHPELRKRWLVAVAVCAAVFAPVDVMIRHAVRQPEIVRFADPRGGMLGIRWPSQRTCLIVSGPIAAPSATQAAQVMPWVRHTCENRLDCVFLPIKDATAMHADSGEAVFSAHTAICPLPEPAGGAAPSVNPEDVAFIPDSAFYSVYDPGASCTCAVRYRPAVVDVKVGMPGFDTVFSLPASGAARRRGEADLCEDHSAVVFRLAGGHSSAAAVVPFDHPLR
jgi:hypothetical protein